MLDPFNATFEQLYRDFTKRGIAVEVPGFCDHGEFLRCEQNENPEYLNNYAAFISKMNFTDDYLRDARLKIGKISSLLSDELLKSGRQGACVDISGILGRILAAEGIWNCIVKGSVTTFFPAGSGVKTKYLWSIDSGDFTAGHAWIFAPPFQIVDLTIGQQSYSARESSFFPTVVLSEERSPVEVDVRDVVSPNAETDLKFRGLSAQAYVLSNTLIPRIFRCFPPLMVPFLNDAYAKYVPVAFGAPDGDFQSMSCMHFEGLTPFQLYAEKIKPALSRM